MFGNIQQFNVVIVSVFILEVIYCAFMRLQSLPYFLDFETVWQELDVSETN